MHNLEVVFPKPTSTGHPTQPDIDAETRIAHPLERINWKFYTADSKIKFVEVSFGVAKFFENADNAKKFSAKLDMGQAIIWGTVPESKTIKECKYTIRGYDKDPTNVNANPKVLSELDPKIVIAVP